MKREYANLLLIDILLIIIELMFLSSSLYALINKALLYISITITLLLLLINTRKTIRKNHKIIIIISAILLMVVSFAVHAGGLGSFLLILNFFALLYLANKQLLPRKGYRHIYFLIAVFYLINAYATINVWNNFLTGKSNINPNTIAMNILYASIMIAAVIDNSLKKKRLFIILLIIINTILILNCHCRNAIIALWIFAIIIFTPFLKRNVSKYIDRYLWMIIPIEIIIPLLYANKSFGEVQFINDISNKEIYSGREIIWKEMFESLKDKSYGYFIGLGSHNATRIGIINNYHTWYLGILYMYGIPVMISYFYYLINKIKSLISPIIKIGFLAIFITGIFETAAIWVYVQYLIFILLLLDKTNKDKTENSISGRIEKGEK